MICPECSTELVQSNMNYMGMANEIGYEFYTMYFCFDCGSLYECTSESGDFTVENLEKLY